MKNIERQRSIDEATSKGRIEKIPASDKTCSRRNRSKGSSKSSVKDEGAELPKLNYSQILQNFVANKFQAECYLGCLESAIPPGYICKVDINVIFGSTNYKKILILFFYLFADNNR